MHIHVMQKTLSDEMKIRWNEGIKGIPWKDPRPWYTGVCLAVPNGHFYLPTIANHLSQHGKTAKKSQSGSK